MARRAPRPLAALTACLILLGCARATSPAAPLSRTEEYGAPSRVLPAATLDPAACGAFGARTFTGDHFTALATLSQRAPMRILWPGQRVTDEVQPQRLNVQVSDSGRITGVFCG